MYSKDVSSVSKQEKKCAWLKQFKSLEIKKYYTRLWRKYFNGVIVFQGVSSLKVNLLKYEITQIQLPKRVTSMWNHLLILREIIQKEMILL